MASKTKIANMALIKLGINRITSISEDTEPARLVNELFDELRDEVAVQGPWSSLIRRADLAALSAAPEYGYDYQFQLPSNPYCLRVLSINEAEPGTYDYRIEGRMLLMSNSTVKIKYIARVDNTGDYDPMFIRALSFRIAAELAYPLTGNRSLGDSMYQLFVSSVRDGLAVDGQAGSSEQLYSTDLINLRGD